MSNIYPDFHDVKKEKCAIVQLGCPQVWCQLWERRSKIRATGKETIKSETSNREFTRGLMFRNSGSKRENCHTWRKASFFFLFTAGANIGVDYLHITFKKLISQCVMRASPLMQDVNMAENMKEKKQKIKKKKKLKHIHFNRFAYERKQRSADKICQMDVKVENMENTSD